MYVGRNQRFEVEFLSTEFSDFCEPETTNGIHFTATLQWYGQTWHVELTARRPIPGSEYPSNVIIENIPEGILEDAKEFAERKAEQLLLEQGYTLPVVAPEKICLTSVKEPDPLQIIAELQDEPYQIRRNEGNPTAQIHFENGVLHQLWVGTEQKWRKGEPTQFETWEEWREVPDSQSENLNQNQPRPNTPCGLESNNGCLTAEPT